MPKFQFNPNNVDVGFPLFPKDTYELELGEPKTFFFEGQGDKPARSGVAVMSKIAEGEYKGKPYYISFDFANSYGEQGAMTLLVVACGFIANDDGVAQFRAAYGQQDFTVDTDQKVLGEGWNLLKAKHVYCDLDQVASKTDKNTDGTPKIYQGFPKFHPIVG